MKKISLVAVSVLLVGCAAKPIKHSQITPTGATPASLRPVALQAAQSVAKAKATAQSMPESQQKHDVLVALSETEASVAQMTKQIGAVVKAHERLTKEKETLYVQVNEKQRELLKLQDKHGKIILQRNVLAGVIAFGLLSFAGFFFGPRLLKLIWRAL